jgi:hypothetical protein
LCSVELEPFGEIPNLGAMVRRPAFLYFDATGTKMFQGLNDMARGFSHHHFFHSKNSAIRLHWKAFGKL